MKASNSQSSPDNSFNPIEAYMRIVSTGSSLNPDHSKYVICDNIRILVSENELVFQDLLVQAADALIDLGLYLTIRKNLLHELIVDYYLRKTYENDDSTIKSWIMHHSKEIYVRNKYRLAS